MHIKDTRQRLPGGAGQDANPWPIAILLEAAQLPRLQQQKPQQQVAMQLRPPVLLVH